MTGSTADRPSRLPGTVYLLGAVAFVMGTTSLVVAGLLPQIAAAAQVSIPRAGLLITVFALGMVVGAPVLALATLRLPRRATLALALVLFALAHLVIALSTDFAVLLTARFVAAVATGTFWAVGAVVATAAAGPGQSIRAMGVVISGVTLASIAGVPLGTAVGQAFGWQGPFWGLAVLGLLAAVAVARGLRADPPREPPSIRAELASVRRGRLWLVYLSAALLQGSVLATYSYVAPLLTDRGGLPAGAIPLVMLGYGLAALLGIALVGRASGRRPVRLLLGAAAVMVTVYTGLALGGDRGPVAAGLILVLGVVALSTNPVLVAEMGRVVGTPNTLAMALGTSAFNIGIAWGSWAGGLALASSLAGQGPPLVSLAGVLAGLVPVVALALARPAGRASPA